MPTELIWDGKYNPDGIKRFPLRVELPFQTIKTVNESAQERQHMLDLFSYGQVADWRNRLIETKGREDADVARKDERAEKWCEDVTATVSQCIY